MTPVPSTAAPVPAAAPATGALYDLAYQRYNGTRRGPAWRIAVIARYGLLLQLRTKGTKFGLLLGALSLVVVAMVAGSKWSLPMLLNQGGGGRAMETDLGAAMLAGLDRDVALYPLTAQWVTTFLLVLLGGAPSLAADLNAGAFQFHFARPVTREHYLVGRFLGAIGWAAVAQLATLAVLVGERLVFQGSPAAVLKMGLAGLLGALTRLLVLGAVALGVSSLTRRKGLAQAFFAAMVFGSAMFAAMLRASTDQHGYWAASVMGAPTLLAEQLVGETVLHGPWAFAPAAGVAGWTVLGLGVALWRLRGAEVVRG